MAVAVFIKFNKLKLSALEDLKGYGGKIGDNDCVKGGGVSGCARVCVCVFSGFSGCIGDTGDGERGDDDDSGDGDL